MMVYLSPLRYLVKWQLALIEVGERGLIQSCVLCTYLCMNSIVRDHNILFWLSLSTTMWDHETGLDWVSDWESQARARS